MEDYGKSLLTQYEPLDLDSIKLAKITSERELENEASNICEILKDTSKTFYEKLIINRGRLELETESSVADLVIHSYWGCEGSK